MMAAVTALGCAIDPGGAEAVDAAAAEVAHDLSLPLASPAAPGSAEPNLSRSPDGPVLMSWLEPLEAAGAAASSTRSGRFALRFATLQDDTWSPARTIAEGDDFFVNWADFPMIIDSDGVLVAHWLRKNGGRGTAYDIHIGRSLDGGETWLESVVPHHDGTPTEHGFVSLVPEPLGGFTAVWLDGRKYAEAENESGREMTLRATRFDPDGKQGPVELLDERICDCCQTSATYVGDTLVAVYRDRSPEEVRDIRSVRRTADGWQQPVAVADDGWQIPGCPVNGPALAADDSRAAVAWFTMREGNPEVNVAFSDDAGASFSQPILLHRGSAAGVDGANPRQVAGLADASDAANPIPLGRVDVAWVDASRVAVIWAVARGADADVVLQTVDRNGDLGERRVVAGTGSMRGSGFPQMVRQGGRLVLAWTETGGDSSSVRTASVALPLR